MDLLDFHILLTKSGGEINVGAVTQTLQAYLQEGLKIEFENLEYLFLDLVEGGSAKNSNGKTSSSLRYVGQASFVGYNTEPDQITLHREQGSLLVPPGSLPEVRVAVGQNAALEGVVVEEVSFDPIDACQPFPNDCNGDIKEEDNTMLVIVSAMGGISLLVMGVATVLLRRRMHYAREEAAAKHQAEMAVDETSLPSEAGNDLVQPGCASLVGSAVVSLGVSGNPALVQLPLTPGTPYSGQRATTPQEISIRQFGEDDDDDMDLDYLTMDEDLKSTVTSSVEVDEQSLSP